MTEDEVAKLAREAGDDWDHTLPEDREFLIRFANLVRANRKPLTEAQIEIAWRHGWASCRDAEYVGKEAEDERWGSVCAEVAQATRARGNT